MIEPGLSWRTANGTPAEQVLRQHRRIVALAGVLFVLGAGLGRSEAAEPWTLEQTLHYAATNSPDARIAQTRIAAARAGLHQAEAAFRPRLQFQSSYTRTDNPMRVFGAALNQEAYSPSLDFNDVPDADNLNVAGVLTVPLYSAGQNTAGRAAARARSRAAREQAEVIDQTVAFEVVRSFHTILKTRDFVKAAAASVDSFAANLTIASNRFHNGAALKTDVLDMEVKLAEAREDLARVRNARSLALRALSNLLGVEDEDFEIAADPLPQTTTLPPAPGLLPPDSGPRTPHDPVRPELTVLQAQARAAEADVDRARGGYKPRVHAFGSVEYDRGWEFDGDGRSYTAGLLLQWDIWDGQLTRAKVSAARSELDAIREQERKTRLAIDFEVEQARLRYEEASERLTVTEKSVEHARESVTLTRARFEQGLALAAQLIDAETALTAARVRRAEAEADWSIAIAAWRKALGLPQLGEPSQP